MQISHLHDALQGIHKEVAANCQNERTKAQRLHNARTGVMPVMWKIGEYVLVRRNKLPKHKHSSEWIAPMRIVNSKSALVFAVENFLRTEKQTVHAQRLLRYQAQQSHDELSTELMEQAEYLNTSH